MTPHLPLLLLQLPLCEPETQYPQGAVLSGVLVGVQPLKGIYRGSPMWGP